MNQCLLTEPISTRTAGQTPRFVFTTEAKFEGLLQQGVFSLVQISETKNQKIFGSRFVDEIRHGGTPQAKYKPCLVAQAYDDNEKGILTYAPTLLKCFQRLILHVVAQEPEHLFICLPDITQAYPQTHEELARIIYLRQPPQFGFPSEIVFRVERGLYGLPESGFLWYGAFHGHHTKTLGMTAAEHDPCFLYTHGMLGPNPPPP